MQGTPVTTYIGVTLERSNVQLRQDNQSIRIRERKQHRLPPFMLNLTGEF